MMRPHMGAERGVPLWAIGAPIIGVPLMVVLLTLTGPAREVPDHSEATIDLMQPVGDHALGLPIGCPVPTSGS